MKKLLSLLLGACTVFAACTDDVENIRQDGSTKLAVNVKVNPTSRAMVHGTALPGGSSIGINVTDATGNPYDGKDAGYLNVQYTATGEAGAQTWAPATNAVLLSGTEGKMHAYYPWTSGIDYKAVAVDVTDQIDWMYAADTYTVSDAKNAHEIVLSHAQTAVNVNLVRDASYTGIGAVEALTVTSEGLASTASLDTRDGSFASITGANTDISIIEAPYILDGTTLSSHENPYMFIPASAETKDFTVSATLDGKSYSHKVTMAEAFAPGKVYKINVTFKNTGLEVSTVTLVDWVETGLGDAEFKPQTPDNGSTTDYSDWVKIIYKVDDASQPVNLFCSYQEEEDENGEMFRPFEISCVDKLAIQENIESRSESQPIEIEPALSYKFTSTGEHAVYIKFQDMTKIPMCSFLQVLAVIDFELPESIKTIDIGAFAMCQNLKEIIIPDNVEYLKGQENENNPEPMGPFAGCTNATRVVLSKNLKEIGSGSFLFCINLAGTVEIPNSVIRIGTLAFCNTKISEITLGQNLQTIGPGAFEACTNLTKIKSTRSSAPVMGSTSWGLTGFGVLPNNGILYIPEGCTAAYSTWMSTSKYFLGCYNWTIQEMTE